MRQQFPFHQIVVHVLQFLEQLLGSPHVEIVKALLPERSRRLSASQARGSRKCLLAEILLSRRERETSCFKTCRTFRMST